jgi:hypothetical protein
LARAHQQRALNSKRRIFSEFCSLVHRSIPAVRGSFENPRRSGASTGNIRTSVSTDRCDADTAIRHNRPSWRTQQT